MKIIQIAATETMGEDQMYGTLYALADDGSVWIMINPWEGNKKWKKLPELGEVK